MWKPYRQVPVTEHQVRWLIICLWGPFLKRWVFCKVKCLLFGLAGAVKDFNRIPTLFTAFVRRVLAVPAQQYFDDFRILEPYIGRGSAYKYFKLAADLLGIKFDATKDTLPTPILPLLGNMEDFTIRGCRLYSGSTGAGGCCHIGT